MKKGLMLSFLFWTLLALIIFVPATLWASKIINFNTKASESFENLAETILSVDDDKEIESTPLYLDDRSVLVGFSKHSDKFEKHNYYPKNPNPDQIAFRFTRPESEKCPIDKSCICLCKDSYLGLQDTPPEATKCNDPKCRAFDDLDFLSEKIIEKYDDGTTKSSLKGGFIYFRSKNSPLPEESKGVRTLYVQRFRNIIDVCTSSPCFPDELRSTGSTNILPQCGGNVYGNCPRGSCVKDPSGSWTCSSKAVQYFGCYKAGTVDEIICTSQPGCSDVASQCRINTCASYPQCLRSG